jgi:hypothetical protein
LPASHAGAELRPAPAQYLPAGQIVHATAALPSENVPSGHKVGPNLVLRHSAPGVQGVHEVARPRE